MKTEFGDVAGREVHKGENVGWYLDQRLVSILVSDWKRLSGPGRVKLVPRNTHTDRSVLMCLRDIAEMKWATQPTNQLPVRHATASPPLFYTFPSLLPPFPNPLAYPFSSIRALPSP